MALELKDISAFTGIELKDDMTPEQLADAFNAKYVPVETHSKALGELNGKVAHAIKKGFKDIGVEVDSAELKDKSLTDLPSIFASAVKVKFDELDSQKGATAETIEAKYKGDIEKYKGIAAEKETMLKTVAADFDGFKATVEQDKRTSKIDSEFSKHYGALKFSETANQYAKVGFQTELTKKYTFDLDTEGKHIVKDKDGKPVMSKVKAAEPASYQEVIDAEFKEAKLGQVVNPNKVHTFAPTPTIPTTTATGRQVAPRHQ